MRWFLLMLFPLCCSTLAKFTQNLKMKAKQLFVAAVVAVTVGGIFIGSNNSSRIDDEVKVIRSSTATGDFPKPRPQLTKERTWRSVVDEQTKLRIGNGGPLLNPMAVKTMGNGDILVSDWGDKTIKRYNKDGRFVMVYGKGRGRGPGEFVNPTDFSTSEDGDVWVCDPGSGLVSIFSADGALHRTFRPQKPPLRITVAGRGKSLLMYAAVGEKLFALCGEDGKEIHSFGTLLHEQAKHGLALDGWIALDRHQGLLYAASRAGILAGFSNDGNLRFYVETLDQVGFPKLYTKGEVGNRVTWIDPKARWATLSIGVVGEEIFLLSATTVVDTAKRGIIDVYSLHDGSYVYSFRLPTPCSYASVSESFVVTVNDTTVTRWKRRL